MPRAQALSLAIAGVPSALLQALTHQPTFGNKLVAFLCGDASVARSGYCIQLDGYVFERILGGLEPFHQFLEGHSPLALHLLLVPGYQKPLLGVLAAIEVGMEAICRECPNFRAWIEELSDRA